jgi:ketosteroid isomerase-like protein
MSTTTMHRAVTANDKAEILALIDARRHHDQRTLELQSRDLTIWMNGDSAFSQGLVRWWGLQTGWDAPAPFWIRETICFERSLEGWRIVHETASAPLPMDRATAGDSISAGRLRVGWARKDAAFQPCS